MALNCRPTSEQAATLPKLGTSHTHGCKLLHQPATLWFGVHKTTAKICKYHRNPGIANRVGITGIQALLGVRT